MDRGDQRLHTRFNTVYRIVHRPNSFIYRYATRRFPPIALIG